MRQPERLSGCDPWLVLDREVNGTGDEALGMSLMMKRERFRRVAARRQTHLRAQHHATELPRTIGILIDLAFGVIDIGRYHNS